MEEGTEKGTEKLLEVMTENFLTIGRKHTSRSSQPRKFQIN